MSIPQVTGAPSGNNTKSGTVQINAETNNAANIVVQLPAGARLYVGNYLTSSTAATRRFMSPPLQQGRDYQYTLRAEYDSNGQRMTQSKTITVRAGSQSQVNFAFETGTVASR